MLDLQIVVMSYAKVPHSIYWFPYWVYCATSHTDPSEYGKPAQMYYHWDRWEHWEELGNACVTLSWQEMALPTTAPGDTLACDAPRTVSRHVPTWTQPFPVVLFCVLFLFVFVVKHVVSCRDGTEKKSEYWKSCAARIWLNTRLIFRYRFHSMIYSEVAIFNIS